MLWLTRFCLCCRQEAKAQTRGSRAAGRSRRGPVRARHGQQADDGGEAQREAAVFQAPAAIAAVSSPAASPPLAAAAAAATAGQALQPVHAAHEPRGRAPLPRLLHGRA